MPEEKWTDGQRRVMAAFATIRDRIGALDATTVVIVGADHYVLFGPTCLPCCLIGIGDVSGPYERFPGMAQDAIPNNVPLAAHIAAFGRARGVDWAVAKSLQVEHSVGAPARVCALPNQGVAGVIPVYLASGVEPLIAPRRAYEIGTAIRDAVEAWPGDERVAIIGSGGISHWVGLAEMGKVNEAFDRQILDSVARGAAEEIIALPDAYVREHGGNGGLEIRSFLCAMGALPGCRGDIILYEHGREWTAGLGFAELMAAA
jgi:protocatechuate 4,5-dioxygenase, beta chain